MVFGKAFQPSGLIFQVDSLVAHDVEPEAESRQWRDKLEVSDFILRVDPAYYVEVRSAIHAHV
jgi:hypothetical protein